MTDWKKVLMWGFVMWLVPFVVAFAFYTPDGKLTIDQLFFKQIMVFTGSLVGAIAMVKYFKTVKSGFAREGLIAGCVWLAMNWFLDIVILLPLSKIALSAYFTQIGLGYFSILFFTAAVGYTAEYVKTGWKGISEAVAKKK